MDTTIRPMVAMAVYVTVLWLIICVGAGFYIWLNNRNHRLRAQAAQAAARAGQAPAPSAASPPGASSGQGASAPPAS